ncbi:MAG: pilus assembly protein [Pirellulales bacterium]|nr:pilus assembly protein [Pirellulales bacterium]
MKRQAARCRRGTTVVEFAIVGPIAFFLIFATIIGALGTFRYQQVATLAREGTRWASVHGGQYEQETGQAAASAADVYTSAIQPRLVGLDPDQLNYQVTWNQNNMPLTVTSDYSAPVGNTVTVRVTYQWFPELYLVGPIALTSTSTAQMAY